ncbi:MAG TPA: efflux RND transporter periplasmic adaptor subunit [Anaerolineaceae bacterium]|nr:efflux RND transporter periplasmic adaptor subunit [Anaerolineaceae bacterium]
MRRTLIPIIVLILLVAAGVYYSLRNRSQSQRLIVSGTIEATQIHVGSQLGGLAEEVYAAEGQTVAKGDILAEVRPAAGVPSGYTDPVRSPINGVILARVVEPGEICAPGGTLFTVADLSSVTLTVYVPEARYGQINLGQTIPVTVDSFPERIFTGTVTYIADQAEFTPRNVQTVQGRKDTVYAMHLTLDNPDLALKPGMPADAELAAQ